MMDIHEIGQQAEQQACDYLEKKGFKLLARNYRCAFGEIDLIMRDKEDVVFVEVRKRAYTSYASAIESVNQTKQRKLIKAATAYLLKQRWFDKVPCRFDVIGFSQNQLEWIKNAFTADSNY